LQPGEPFADHRPSLSGHGNRASECRLFEAKADMTLCGNLFLRSLMGAKRTCRFALHMSAYDPKRTSINTGLILKVRAPPAAGRDVNKAESNSDWGKPCSRAPCQSLNFFKDLIGRLHGGYIAASSGTFFVCRSSHFHRCGRIALVGYRQNQRHRPFVWP
jgi:hypothetical protein